jgi:molybdopterin converting factor subunit 1
MRLLFFAQLKDATKCDSAELALENSLTGEELWNEIIRKFPALAAHKKNVRLARNAEYAHEHTRYFDADEVALIPPVSGG